MPTASPGQPPVPTIDYAGLGDLLRKAGVDPSRTEKIVCNVLKTLGDEEIVHSHQRELQALRTQITAQKLHSEQVVRRTVACFAGLVLLQLLLLGALLWHLGGVDVAAVGQALFSAY